MLAQALLVEWFVFGSRLHLRLFEGQLQRIANEATHMIVGKLFEFLGSEQVGEESEYLRVRELDVVLALLLGLVVQADDAVDNARVASLLRLVFEFDRIHGDLRLYLHVPPLVHIEQLLPVQPGHLAVPFATSYRNVLHQEINFAVDNVRPITRQRVVIECA